jgi:hypothetical protein
VLTVNENEAEKFSELSASGTQAGDEEMSKLSAEFENNDWLLWKWSKLMTTPRRA